MTDVITAKSDISNKINTKKKDKSNKENVDQEKKYDEESSSKVEKKSSKKVASSDAANKPAVTTTKTTSSTSFFSISSSVPLTGVVAKKRASPVEEKETKKAKVTPIAHAAPIPSFSFSIGPSFGGAVKAPSFTSTLPKPVVIEKKASVTAKEKEVKAKASVSLIEKEEAMTDVIEEAKEEERVRSAVKKSASKPPAPQMAKRTPPKPAASAAVSTSITVATSPMPSAAAPTMITSTIPNPSFHTQSSSLLTPIIPAPVTIRPSLQAPVASASALLADYQSTLELQRLLSQKDAAYELLSTKYAQLREAKKTEVNTLVDGVTKTAEQGSKSVAALVAHWKKEVAEAQEHAEKVEKKMIDFPEKMHKVETEKMLEIAKNQAYEAEIEALQQALQSETRKNAQLQEQMSDQRQLEKIIRAYLLLTSMQVNVKNNGWVNCRMINRADNRELSFDLDVDAEEEIEYAPQKIDLNGVNYPGWMTEGLFMQPDMAPRLLKLMLANVYKKEEEQ